MRQILCVAALAALSAATAKPISPPLLKPDTPPLLNNAAKPVSLPVLNSAASSGPAVGVAWSSDGSSFNVTLDGAVWLESAATTVCVRGAAVPLSFVSSAPTAGVDVGLGAYTGVAYTFATADAGAAPVVLSSRTYASSGTPFALGVAVLTAAFPAGLDTSGCGGSSTPSTRFPAFSTSAALAPTLGYLSWRGTALGTTVAVRGLNALNQGGLDAGPVVATDEASGASLVWSTLDSHKIVVQATGGGAYAMGLSAAVSSIPANYTYSVLLSAAAGGATAATYAWGAAAQAFSGTTRSPSVTLSSIGYYTDDGAYYYVWEAFGCCDPVTHAPRPWPAEVGLVKVKEDLLSRGVPIAYVQMDDWWYIGRFYFGNVKVVEDWHASNASRLFPNGAGLLANFQAALGLPLQLYTPFWDSVKFDPPPHKYNMTESTVFKGTKLVVPADSYRFFADQFDLGAQHAGGRENFVAYEIDFLDSNFAGSSSMFETVYSADLWYAGMADAALERGLVIQYCLPSATDMLQSLRLPAVVQARASADYVNVDDNPHQLGGSSLLMGALAIAPSKDTLWTASPQPPTYSDTKQNGDYTTQPHVQLDAVLATLSLGPVGISDGLGQTDVGLISQAFRSPTDGTLLRPARPLSFVDAFFFNQSFARGPAADVRATHSAVPTHRGGGGDGADALVTHLLVAWKTTADVTLGPTDLFPAPPPGAALALRQHVFAPAGAAQQAGCVDGAPAVPNCVALVAGGVTGVVVPATGADEAAVALWHAHAPLPNGAYFLGELTKFVHVSPQRFEYVLVDAAAGGRAGLVAGVRGSAGQAVNVTAVAPDGTVVVVVASVPESGFAVVPV